MDGHVAGWVGAFTRGQLIQVGFGSKLPRQFPALTDIAGLVFTGGNLRPAYPPHNEIFRDV